MLDSIMGAVKGQIISAITENTGLQPGQAEQAIPLAQESVTEGITSALTGGNVEGLMGMLTSAVGGGNSGGGLLQNMVYKGIAGNFISKATSAFGVSEELASTVSSLALPAILNKLGSATQAAGDTDGIDVGSMMSALGIDAGSLLGGLAGSGQAGDLLGKAMGMLGDTKDQGQSAAGGLLGKLGGLFK